MTKVGKIMTLVILAGVVALVAYASLRHEDVKDREAAIAPGRVQIAATIFPVYDIINQVGRDLVAPQLLLPAGASPHTFDPSPRDIEKLADAEVVLAIGHSIDNWADTLAASADVPVRTLDTGVAFREFGVSMHADEHADDHHDEDEHEEEASHDDHAHEGEDPHYWLSPIQAMQMANNVVEILSALDPANTRTYQANAREFRQTIEANMIDWRRELALISDPEIITFHDAFGYFAADLGVEVVATVEPFAGQQPTPQYLAELGHTIEDTGVTALFLEPQLASNSIEAFAKDNNLTLGTLDPIGGVDGRDSYVALIEYNVNQITSAFAK